MDLRFLFLSNFVLLQHFTYEFKVGVYLSFMLQISIKCNLHKFVFAFFLFTEINRDSEMVLQGPFLFVYH